MANRPMQVSINVSGVSAATNNLRQLAAQMRQIQQLQNGFNGGGGGGGFPSVPRRRGGGGGGRPRSTFLSRLAGLVGSTRLNLGVASPLVGRIGGLVGGAAGGPVTLGLAAAATALGTFTSAVNHAAQSAAAFSGAASVSGAGPGQLGRLSALGLGPTEAADVANQLRARLESDPMAQLRRSQMGLGFVAPGKFGPTDNAKILADTLEGLRQITNAEEQLRAARSLGLEGYLEELRVSAKVYNARKRDAAEREKLLDPQTLQQFRDFNGEMRRLGDAWNDLLTATGKEMLPAATELVRSLTQMIKDARPAVQEMAKVFNDTFMQAAVKLAALANGMNPDSAWAGYQAAQRLANSDLAQAAINANTDALKRNTNALWAQTPGTFGGGARARGALPSQFAPLLQGAAAGSPSEFNQLVNGKTLALGPWSL